MKIFCLIMGLMGLPFTVMAADIKIHTENERSTKLYDEDYPDYLFRYIHFKMRDCIKDLENIPGIKSCNIEKPVDDPHHLFQIPIIGSDKAILEAAQKLHS